MVTSETPVVLLVEDEPEVADGYELWLTGDYEIRRAHDGQEALDVIDDSVDVVLLDRMMPKLSGPEVLAAIRERDLDCRVAMLTAVEPDFDVIEMGFDAYLTKPPERDALVETVEDLLDRATLDDEMQAYYSLMARKGALETEKEPEELEQSEEYQDLLGRIETARSEVDGTLGDMGDDADFLSAVADVTDDSEGEL